MMELVTQAAFKGFQELFTRFTELVIVIRAGLEMSAIWGTAWEAFFPTGHYIQVEHGLLKL
jgi:hypothetical protein